MPCSSLVKLQVTIVVVSKVRRRLRHGRFETHWDDLLPRPPRSPTAHIVSLGADHLFLGFTLRLAALDLLSELDLSHSDELSSSDESCVL